MVAGTLSPVLDDGVAIKEEIYLSSQRNETNEVLHDVSPQQPVSLVSLLQVPRASLPTTPAPHHFTTVKVCIYQEKRRPKSFLAPELGVGMPGLIWLNLCLSVHACLVCMPLRCGVVFLIAV